MTFRHLVQKLRKHAPPLLPVRVYVRERLSDWGCTSLMVSDRDKPLRFVIEVRKSLPIVMRDSLLHEWAHALTWAEGQHVPTDHSDSWGLAHARCYRIVVEP